MVGELEYVGEDVFNVVKVVVAAVDVVAVDVIVFNSLTKSKKFINVSYIITYITVSVS